MTISDAIVLVLAAIAGVLLGGFFFGGLWWTIRMGLSSKRPALWFLGSLLVRTSVVLGGFYFVAGNHWDRLLACLVGFVVARLVVTRLTRPPVEACRSKSKEVDHAP
jgi:F1F0 ATPase subunit 2